MIKEFTLKNDKLEATFINLGASITKLVDLKSGINVVVGHHDYETYKKNPGSMNAVIGRHSGRITDFNLDGETIRLEKNVNNQFQLHGGVNGFQFKYFDAEVFADKIKFSLVSSEGEGGFPGEIKFSITYQLVDNELHLIYEAVSDKKTIMNYTNHAYFNLNGNINDTILDHNLYINADYYIELQSNLIPLRKAPVKNTPLDFTTSKKVGQDINACFEQLKITGGIDHPFLITKLPGITHVATLTSDKTNLRLDVFSDQAAVVCYSGNFLDDTFVLNDGVKGVRQGAICLETQGIPNGVNIPGFEDKIIYDANEVYHQTTIWKLS